MELTSSLRVNRIPQAKKAFLAGVEEILGKGAVDITARWAASVPVDTGRYKNSIRFEADPRGGVWIMFSDVEYAPYIELGTRFMAARPDLQRAWESVVPSVLLALKGLERRMA